MDDKQDEPGVLYMMICPWCHGMYFKQDGVFRLPTIEERVTAASPEDLEAIRAIQRRQVLGLDVYSIRFRQVEEILEEEIDDEPEPEKPKRVWTGNWHPPLPVERKWTRKHCFGCGDYFKTERMLAEHCFFEASSLRNPDLMRLPRLLVRPPGWVTFTDMIELTRSYGDSLTAIFSERRSQTLCNSGIMEPRSPFSEAIAIHQHETVVSLAVGRYPRTDRFSYRQQ